MEVHQDGQLAVDDPFGEVLLVLHVEGNTSVGGQMQGPGEIRERRRVQDGPRGDDVRRRGRGGGGKEADVIRRDADDSPHKQPCRHLREERGSHG